MEDEIEVRAQVLISELKALFHPNPSLSRPYSEAQLASAAEWIENQKKLKNKVLKLSALAQRVSFRLPYFSEPYEENAIEEIIEPLKQRVQRWGRFDALEARWAKMNYTRQYLKDEREALDIEKEIENCSAQEGLWHEYQAYVFQYAHLGLAATVHQVPMDKSAIEDHKVRVEFNERWLSEIEVHKSVLLSWYKTQISFPQAPLTGENIEPYIDKVRPYLKRSRVIRFWSWTIGVLVSVSGLSYWQYNSHEKAQALEIRAKGIGWELDISGPPYLSMSRYDLEVTESERNTERAQQLSVKVGYVIPYPWTDQRLEEEDGAYEAEQAVIQKEQDYGIQSVSVSGGRFMMGCIRNDDSCRSNEKPSHQVTITHELRVMATEVTQDLYTTVKGVNPSKYLSCGLSCPVENVSWYNAVSFANALSQNVGLSMCYKTEGEEVHWLDTNCNGWRLPTEAEWEYLARGGEAFLYSGGDSIEIYGWTNEDYQTGATHEVALKAPNGFGLYDMSGNISEWTWDYYGKAYYAEAVSIDPRGPSHGEYRVVRGGSWYNDSNSSRVTDRYSLAYPSMVGSQLGFRLVRRIKAREQESH